MTKITKFNKSTCQALRNAFFLECEEKAKELGMTMKFGNIRFTDFDVKVSVELKIDSPEAAAKVDDRQVASLGLYGLTMNETVKIGSHTYTIKGFNSKKRTKPIMIEREDGKSFIASTEQILSAKKFTTAIRPR